MSANLSDAELIQLVQAKLPEELSEEEIRQLHARLRESDELKAVLIEQLHLESYLNQALADIDVSVDEILQKAVAQRSESNSKRWPMWTGLASVLLLIGLGIYWSRKTDPPPQQVAQLDEKTPDENDPDNKAAVDSNPDSNPGNSSPTDKKPTDTNTDNPPVKPQDIKPKSPNWGVPSDPWFAALNPKTPLKSIAESAFEFPEFEYGNMLTRNDAAKWFQSVPGHSFRFERREHDKKEWVRFRGTAKLRAPFVDHAVLRMTAFESDKFHLHFWSKDNPNEGITLRRYRHRTPRIWAAYSAKRSGNKAEPEELVSFLCSDNGSFNRGDNKRAEFRYQFGHLVMSQGEHVLLRVPLSGPPGDVIFDGDCDLSELTMYRGEAIPDPNPPVGQPVYASDHPSDRAWLTEAKRKDLREGWWEVGQSHRNDDTWTETLGPGITVSADGAEFELAAEKTEDAGFVMTRLKQPGLFEVIFRVENASPGTAICFGDDQGKILHRVGFFYDRRSKQILFESSRAYETHQEVDKDPNPYFVPYWEPGQWIRVTWNFGNFKVYTSPDGMHWSVSDAPIPDLPGPYSTIGLLIRKTDEAKRIRLSHFQVREFPGLGDLVAEAKPLPDFAGRELPDFAAWHEVVAQAWRADDVRELTFEDYRVACAVKSLGQLPWSELSTGLLRGVLESVLESDRSLEERRLILDEVCDLYYLRDGNQASAIARMYERLGKIAAMEGHPDPFGFAQSALQASPIWTAGDLRMLERDFIEEIAMYYVANRNWSGLRQMVLRESFYDLHPNPSRYRDRRKLMIRDWGEGIANYYAPNAARPLMARRARASRQWMPPLQTRLSKEGYNVMAEFEAALNSEAYTDACRIISAAGQSGMAGLLPDSRDEDLLVSLPRAIEIAMRDNPELQSTMRNEFGDIGRIRVREAMSRSDVSAVEATTIQFYGTAAAAEAYRWLGDRALASGRFAQAAQSYQEGLPFAEDSLKREIHHRLQLAAGMLGHEIDSPESSTVQIASQSWTKDEFNALLHGLAESRKQTETLTNGDWTPQQTGGGTIPKAAVYTSELKNRFAGDIGRGVGRYEDRDTDWVARQIAIAQDEDAMYVSNRFQVVSYDLQDGKTRWSRGLGSEQNEANAWPFIAMKPLIVGDRIFVRRLGKRGPELACLKKTDGDVLWHVRPEHHIASDPVFVGNRLLSLVLTIPQSGLVRLELTAFHPETGEVLSQIPVVTLRDEWGGRPACEIAAAGGRILCSLGGTTVCVNPSGQPQWLQRSPWVPATIDTDANRQYHQPPFVFQDRVVTAQSGVKEVACLDLATGRKQWTSPAPDLVRIAGVASETVILQTEFGLRGLDRDTGDVRWEQTIADVQDGLLCGPDQLMCCVDYQFSKDGNPCLIWLDANTGESLSHCVLDQLEVGGLRFGPFVQAGNRIWALQGDGYKEASRNLIALTPQTNLQTPGPLDPNHFTDWVDNIRPQSFANMARVLPGWNIVSSQNHSGRYKGVQFLPEFRGDTRVLQTRLFQERPVHFSRRISLPTGKNSRLKVRVGFEAGGKPWTLELHAGDKKMLSQELNDQSAPNGWWETTVDLNAFAGRTIWLTATQTGDPKEAGAAYWKSLDIISDQ